MKANNCKEEIIKTCIHMICEKVNISSLKGLKRGIQTAVRKKEDWEHSGENNIKD